MLAALTLTRLPLSSSTWADDFRFGQHPPGLEFPGFFKQCKHGIDCPMQRCLQPRPRKAEHLVDVPVEVGQPMVAAFQQLDAGAGVAAGHFAPVQHFVALGDHGEVILRAARAGRFPARAVRPTNPGSKKKCCGGLVPGGLLADGAGQVARRIDGRVEQHRPAARLPRPHGWRRSRPATTRSRPWSAGGQCGDPVHHHVHGGARARAAAAGTTSAPGDGVPAPARATCCALVDWGEERKPCR